MSSIEKLPKTSRRNFYRRLSCAMVVAGATLCHGAMVNAASATGKLAVTVRVATSCRISSDPLALAKQFPHGNPLISLDCGQTMKSGVVTPTQTNGAVSVISVDSPDGQKTQIVTVNF